jgi:F-type H+-transporting ATPase subunit epsilon
MLFSGQADQADLPGADGDFGVLAGHAPVVAMFKATIDGMQEGLAKESAGAELDRAIERLDHYKSIHTSLATTTAF